MSIRRHYLDVVNKLYNGESRPFINKFVEVLDKEWWRKNVFLIDAPTGYGKTAISLTIAKYSVEEELKAIIAYPLRTLLDGQAKDFRKFFEKCGLGPDLVGVRYMLNPESPYLIKPVTLTTVDTLALTSMGISPSDIGKVLRGMRGGERVWGSMGHYVFSWSSVFTSNIVVDEAHLLADSGKALAFLAFLAEAAVFHDQHLIIMTATLPKYLVNALTEVVGKNRLLKVSFSEYTISEGSKDPFISERKKLRGEHTKYTISLKPFKKGEGVEKAMGWISEVISSGLFEKPRVLAVFNTVKEAVQAYQIARRDLSSNDESGIDESRIYLIHSRFAVGDRDRLAKILSNLSKSNSSKEVKKSERGESYVVIATQAIEAGIDITSNIFVTDAAPPTTIIQRAGRFLRYGEGKGKMLIWWDSLEDGSVASDPNGLYKGVYDAELVKKTLEWIEKRSDKVNLHLPIIPNGTTCGYSELIDTIYKPPPLKPMIELKDLMEDIVIDYLDGSRRAAQLLSELGGSFVRDSTVIPVVPRKELELVNVEGVGNSENAGARIGKLIIPLSPRTFLKLHRSGRVTGIVQSKGVVSGLPPRLRERLDRLANYVFRHPVAALRGLANLIVVFDISSFIVDVDYSPKEGLMI